MKKMEITVASPEETLYRGSAEELSVRTTCGDVKILPGHADFMAEIGCGQLRIKAEDELISTATSSGILYVSNNRVSVLLFKTCEAHTRV